MSKKQQKYIFIGLFIYFGIYQNTVKNDSLEKSGIITEAVIINYEFVYKG